jgi:Na+-driven multidrug efflux pump
VPRDLKPDLAMLRRLLRVGLPVAVSNSSNSVGISVFQVMINTLGTTVIGAMSIGFRIVWFFNMPAQAMAMAAAPVVGQALGAGKVRLARRAVWSSVSLVAVIMFPMIVGLMAGGRLVARAFIDSPDVVAEAGRFFLIVPASSYFFGVLMVLMSAFYGSGHTRPAMVISLLRLWALRLPAAYLLCFVLSWGSLGIYFGMVIGNVLCAGITLWLFFRGGWESAVIDAPGSEPEEAPAGDAKPQ